MFLAGGAFGTPELLCARAFARPGGELGRNLRIHPACWVGARFEDEVRGWEGVMQSYAVDEWEERGILLEATFTPLAFGGQWLPGIGAAHQRRLLEFGNLASTGVHLSDKSAGRVRLGSDGSLRITYQLIRDDADRLVFGIARAAELFYAAGATEVYPQISGMPTLSTRPNRRLEASPRAGGRCGSRRFTRWARRAWTPTRAAASPAPTAPCTGPRGSTSPTAACCRARSASTR